MKRFLFVAFLSLLLMAGVLAWLFVGSATRFQEARYQLDIPSGAGYETVLKELRSNAVIRYPGVFDFLARKIGYPEKIKAGRYLLPKGSSLLSILRKLKNGSQDPVNLVITKVRTKEDLAALAAKKFESDSSAFMAFLNDNKSLQVFGLDSNTVLSAVLPDTYQYYWNTSPAKVFEKIMGTNKRFWNEERKQKAAAKGLSKEQVVVLASIVEEETNKPDEKGNIASVYLNRLQKGMKLGADPTVKFALRDFSLKRIYNKHLAVTSPYNTYRNPGLPPGPICTPQRQTIDAVLNAPSTNYLFFVAKPDFSGYHQFSETYQQHLESAKAYQQALDKLTTTQNGPEDLGH